MSALHFKSKNEKYLIEVFSRSIAAAEETCTQPVSASCKSILVSDFKRILEDNNKEVRGFSADTDYQSIAWAWIINMTFDRLSSGKFHFYTGLLNPQGTMLFHIYNAGMKWAVENGAVLEEERQEQLLMLRDNISRVG